MRRKNPVLLLAILFNFYTTSIAQDCNCPTSTQEGVIVNENTSSRKKECKTENGQTFCTFTCKYKFWNTAYEIWVIGGWFTSSANPGSQPPCKNISGGYWNIMSDKKRLAYAHTFYSQGYPDLAYEALRIAKILINQFESYAVACPGFETDAVENRDGGRKVLGKIIVKSGFLEVFDPLLNKWIYYDGTQPNLFSGQRVRTGWGAKATIQISTRADEEEWVDIGENTMIDVRVDPNEPGPGVTGYVLHLLKGFFSYGSGRNLGVQQKSVTKIITPGLEGAIKGTSFILHHDSSSKRDYIFLKDGKLELKTGNQLKTLQAGQKIFVENKGFSDVYQLTDQVWNNMITGQYDPRREDFLQNEISAKPVRIQYGGNIYNTTYELQKDNNIPIDVYYTEILDPSGNQVIQGGEKLWSRFVRLPAASHTDQSSVRWIFITWAFTGKGWEVQPPKNVEVELLR